MRHAQLSNTLYRVLTIIHNIQGAYKEYTTYNIQGAYKEYTTYNIQGDCIVSIKKYIWLPLPRPIT